MSNILLGRPSFTDWVGILDGVAKRSAGRVHFREFDPDVKEIVSYARRFKIAAVVPSSYAQMKLLANHRDKFAAVGCKVACSDSYELVDSFDDKVRFVRHMQEQGLSELVPEVFVLQHGGQREQYADIRFPCIFKLAVTFGGNGSSVHLSPATLPALDKIPASTSYLVQEFIPGHVEYGGHYYLESGNVRKALYYRGTRDASILVQRGYMTSYDRFETLAQGNAIEQVFSSINFSGFACVDFKVVGRGVKIFEVNPRLGGTVIRNEPDLYGFFDALLE